MPRSFGTLVLMCIASPAAAQDLTPPDASGMRWPAQSEETVAGDVDTRVDGTGLPLGSGDAVRHTCADGSKEGAGRAPAQGPPAFRQAHGMRDCAPDAGTTIAVPGPASGNDPEPAPAALLELEGDAEWGAYLATGCATCHGAGDGRIPGLAGIGAGDLLAAMHAFRTGARDNAVMAAIAGALSDQELAALAAHFGDLAPDPTITPEDPE